MKLRPTYHFMPEKNWMNDPNGPVYYQGEYHLFYQYNPYAYKWDTMHWGHAKSKDLVHWEHLPIALYPSNQLGEIHCFSGCCVISDNGIPTIIYTSIGEGIRSEKDGAEQWSAISNDGMISWEKNRHNPLMTLDIHGGLDITEWRDPFVWKENGQWFMVLGGSISGKGCVLIYKSEDLLRWTFLNILYKDNKCEIIECPNLIKYEDKYILIISCIRSDVRYLIGTMNNDYTFCVMKESFLDYSGFDNGFYAPNTLFEPNGRKIMWGWLTENSRGNFEGIKGWSGVQSIPRVLTLDSNDELTQKPAEEIKDLRTNEVSFRDFYVKGEFDARVRGRALEILTEIHIDNIETDFAISVFASKDREEETLIKLKPSKGEFSVDRSKSSLAVETYKGEIVGKFALKVGETVKLNIFIDYSTIEVFLNDKECLSARVYPTKEDSDNVYLLSSNKGTKVKSMSIWNIRL